MLTLKYGGAVVSALLAVYYSVSVLTELFGLWTGKGIVSVFGTGYTGIVAGAITAALFAVLAFLLYRKVTKEVALAPSYVEKTAYHFITNGFFSVLAVAFVIMVAELVSVLISSLLLIGTSTDIGGLYLNQFLPNLLAVGVVGFTGFAAYSIVKGKNLSLAMTITLMSLAGALLLAVLITVPIKAHGSSASPASSSSNYNYEYDYNDYFNSLRN
jgi:hypothetical protein